jgi:hypothetical protein
VRDLLSGTDVPWSEGVLATDAGLKATEEVIATLRTPISAFCAVASTTAAVLTPPGSSIRV